MKNINGILENSKIEQNIKNDEYIKNGLIYCKSCHTPRQDFFEMDGEQKRYFTIPCHCLETKLKIEEEEENKRLKIYKIEKLRNEGIKNPTYQKYRFEKDDGKTPENTKIFKNYVANFKQFQNTGQGILLFGDVGTGKTFYAMCIANALIDQEYAVKCTTFATIIKQAQDFNNADNHFYRLVHSDLIIVDDLGTEYTKDFGCEQIYKFIDYCNTYNIPLIITTNHLPSEINNIANDPSNLTKARIYSRLMEKVLPVKINEIKRRSNNTQFNKLEMAKILGIK